MKKLSKSEAGKLGFIKSQPTINRLKQCRITKYNQHPNKCKECEEILNYENRHKKFCSHSCSAIYHNRKKTKLVEWGCLSCGKIHLSPPYKTQKYCNHSCQQSLRKQKSLDKFKKGQVSDRGLIRNILIREHGHKCFECGLQEWRGITIPLEVDHIDGNAGNNIAENLRLLCPNCHSITDTWKGKNKGNGRSSRGLSLS